ncbi:MAG: hypothetical protein EOO09_20590 [Chitinophagaceae bacterium]|nr:MAG: hypothetical protein EOO09_20590 [Chitinophagaceae bacterium]
MTIQLTGFYPAQLLSRVCRSIAVLFVIAANTQVVHSQELEKSRVYEIRNSIAVFPCDILGNRLFPDRGPEIPPFTGKFILVSASGRDSVIIRFLPWSSRTNAGLYRRFNRPVPTSDITNETVKTLWLRDSTVPKYFVMGRENLDSNCVKVFNKGWRSAAFTIGLVTMPTKLRLGRNFDFQGNLSLGTTAGIKHRLSRYSPNYVNYLFGASLTGVSLDSFNTKGRIAGQPLNNVTVFSPSLGIVFEFGKAQAGIFYGWDLLNKSTQSRYGWIYNRKPWLSIGFGFSIFSVDSKSSSQGKDENTEIHLK